MSPVVTTVPLTFGSVIVRSSVGFVTVRVVSCASADEPSKTMLESLRKRPVTTGLVNVLLDIVNVLLVVATTAVSTLNVSAPESPPPLNPVPAVTLSMSPATVMLPPRETLVPLIVIAEFVREPFPMLERVFVAPEIDLFVSVSVVARPTSVSVAFGRLKVISDAGSVTVRRVSKSFAVAPSKTTERAVTTFLLPSRIATPSAAFFSVEAIAPISFGVISAAAW